MCNCYQPWMSILPAPPCPVHAQSTTVIIIQRRIGAFEEAFDIITRGVQ